MLTAKVLSIKSAVALLVFVLVNSQQGFAKADNLCIYVDRQPIICYDDEDGSLKNHDDRRHNERRDWERNQERRLRQELNDVRVRIRELQLRERQIERDLRDLQLH